MANLGAEDLFRQIHVMLLPEYMQKFAGITSTPKLAACVRSIAFVADMVDERFLGDDIVPDWECTPREIYVGGTSDYDTDIEIGWKNIRSLAEEQQAFFASGAAVDMLTAGLKLLPDVRYMYVEMAHGPDDHHDPAQSGGPIVRQLQRRTMIRANDLLWYGNNEGQPLALLALLHASEEVAATLIELRINYISYWDKRGEDLFDKMGPISLRNFHKLSILRISIEYCPWYEYDSDTREDIDNSIARLDDFVVSAMNLTELYLNAMEQIYEDDPVCLPNLSSLLDRLYLPKLKVLRLMYGNTTDTALIGFLQRHKDTLESVELWHIYLHSTLRDPRLPGSVELPKEVAAKLGPSHTWDTNNTENLPLRTRGEALQYYSGWHNVALNMPKLPRLKKLKVILAEDEQLLALEGWTAMIYRYARDKRIQDRLGREKSERFTAAFIEQIRQDAERYDTQLTREMEAVARGSDKPLDLPVFGVSSSDEWIEFCEEIKKDNPEYFR